MIPVCVYRCFPRETSSHQGKQFSISSILQVIRLSLYTFRMYIKNYYLLPFSLASTITIEKNFILLWNSQKHDKDLFSLWCTIYQTLATIARENILPDIRNEFRRWRRFMCINLKWSNVIIQLSNLKVNRRCSYELMSSFHYTKITELFDIFEVAEKFFALNP